MLLGKVAPLAEKVKNISKFTIKQRYTANLTVRVNSRRHCRRSVDPLSPLDWILKPPREVVRQKTQHVLFGKPILLLSSARITVHY